jgi:hypothetical protein
MSQKRDAASIVPRVQPLGHVPKGVQGLTSVPRQVAAVAHRAS